MNFLKKSGHSIFYLLFYLCIRTTFVVAVFNHYRKQYLILRIYILQLSFLYWLTKTYFMCFVFETELSRCCNQIMLKTCEISSTSRAKLLHCVVCSNTCFSKYSATAFYASSSSIFWQKLHLSSSPRFPHVLFWPVLPW